jgi:hypothetical protein
MLCNNFSQEFSSLLLEAMVLGRVEILDALLFFDEVKFACNFVVKSEYKYEEALV